MPRRKKKRLRSKSAPAVLQTLKVTKRKQWSNDAMVAALEAVKNGIPIKRAALDHGVPRSTLQDRCHGRVVHGTKPGPQAYLSHSEETELA